MKTARENATDTAQSDMGNMSMSINTFSIEDFVEDYNEDYNKNRSPGNQVLHKQPLWRQPIDEQLLLGSQPAGLKDRINYLWNRGIQQPWEKIQGTRNG